MSGPYQTQLHNSVPFYDNFHSGYQNNSGQQKRRRNRNRNRRNRFQNRQRSDSMVSHSEFSLKDNFRPMSRPRTVSNVSIGGQTTLSSGTNNASMRGSNFGNRGRLTNKRWDRDRLSREIWHYYETHKQTADLLTRKKQLKEALHKILNSNFSNYEVELYIVGSTATGLANNQSDVDICVVMTQIDPNSAEVDTKTSSTDQKEGLDTNDHKEPKVGVIVNVEDSEQLIDKLNTSSDCIGSNRSASNGSPNAKSDPSVPMLEKIEEVLKNYNFVTKMQIILAKVPILKFFDRISGIEVTLNVNKLVSIRNTQLISDYTKLDWRVKPLMMVIKAWAKDHNIKDAYNKSISSYSLVLMVIHYLQNGCQPPVLPCLHQLEPNRYDPNKDIQTIRMNSRPKRWNSHNDWSLKELLIGFLDYYSYTFSYTKDAISVRLGGVVPKGVVQRYKSDDNFYAHWKYLSIEEPFNRTNTARSVYDEVMFEHILSVFRVSHYTLRRYPFLDSIMTARHFSNEYMQKTVGSSNDSSTISYEKRKEEDVSKQQVIDETETARSAPQELWFAFGHLLPNELF